MRFEIEAEVKDRLLEDALGAEKKSYQEPPQSPIAIEEWVNGFKLDVDQSRFDEGRDLDRLGMDERLKIGHQVQDVFGGRRHEERISGAGPSDPVLGSPELAGLLGAAPALRQQDIVDFTNEPERDRKALSDPCETMVHRGDVVRHLLH